MLKIRVTEKSGASIEYTGESEIIERLPQLGHGKPERWVLHKDELLLTGYSAEQVAEAYDEADVLAEEIREAVPATEEAPAVTQKWVQLKAEYTIEIEDITAQVSQQAVNAEALAYLASTDWLIIREVDAGVPCPAEIKAERAAARARIVR